MTTHRLLPLRLVAMLAIAVVVGVLSAPSASAHAALTSALPIDGAVLDESPTSVELVFTEPVTVPADGVRVLDDSGQPLPGDMTVADERTVVVDFEPLPTGKYFVSFRVISEDGHPIRGATSFGVGDVLVGRALSTDTDGAADGNAIGRFLAMLGILVVAGGAVVARWTGMQHSAPVRRLVWAALAVGVVGSAVDIAARIAQVGDFGAALGSGVGVATAVGLAGAIATAALFRARPNAALVAALVSSSSFALTGHSRVGTPVLEVLASAAHASAAAVWLGGLAALAVSRRDGDQAQRRQRVVRFSGLASVAVVVVGAAGLSLSLTEIDTLPGLSQTAYGRTLLVKTALVALVGVAGTYMHFAVLPALASGSDRAWRRFRAISSAEIAGLVLVLGATSVLVQQSPIPPEPPAAVDVATDLGAVRFVHVENRLEVRVVDAADEVIADRVSLVMTHPALDGDVIRRSARRLDTGRYEVGSLTLPATGDWTVRASIRVDEFTDYTFTTTLNIT